DALLRVLDALPAPADGRRAPGWRTAEWTEMLARIRPERAAELDALSTELQSAEVRLDEPPVPVHGDLHEGQVLVHDGEVSGVLDIDTHALGRRTDDLA